VGPEVDLAIAMVIGMGIGTLVHLATGILVSPCLGLLHAMVPGSLVGMYGGMLFAMRDVMQPVSLTHAVEAGALFGLIVTCGVRLYDRALSGGTSDGPAT
jgi:hypothetical protein